MDWQKLLAVGAGGCIGAVLRYVVSLASARWFGTALPWGTLIVNAAGGLLIGLLMELSIATDLISPGMRLFLVTGILGGLTTFSTFSHETMSLIGEGSYGLAALNTGLNLVLAFGGVALGRFLVSSIL